jgi:hypothetical protein
VAKNIMNISLKLIDSQSEINTKILNEIKNYLQPIFNKISKNIQPLLEKDIESVVKSEPEYLSLISGILRSELGIPDADQRIDRMLSAWSSSADIQTKTISIQGSRLVGGFSIYMIRSDFSDILSIPESVIVDSSSGSSIEWLRWLLLEGNKAIILRNYTVTYPGPNSRSRTGNAIMVQSTKNWRIPMAFAGSPTNNWITRAISRLDDTILNRLENELERNL